MCLSGEIHWTVCFWWTSSIEPLLSSQITRPRLCPATLWRLATPLVSTINNVSWHSYNIVDEISEGIQSMSWMTSKEYRYTITWAHKGWLKLMQLTTDAVSSYYLKPSVINHKDVSKPEMKLCKHKYISSSWIQEFIINQHACVYTHVTK